MEETRDQDLAKAAAQVHEEQITLLRHATHPLVNIILSTNPYTGAVSSLLGGIAQQRQETRLRSFLITVAKEVEENNVQLAIKIDKDFLRTEEFSVILEAVLREAASTADVEKLRILRSFLTASTFCLRPDTTWQELFLKYLSQLSGIHLVILEVFYEIQGSIRASDRLGQIEVPPAIPLSTKTVQDRLSTIDNYLLKVACMDLANLGLLIDWRHLARNPRGLQEEYCLTNNGMFFMRYVLGNWQQEPNQPVAG